MKRRTQRRWRTRDIGRGIEVAAVYVIVIVGAIVIVVAVVSPPVVLFGRWCGLW